MKAKPKTPRKPAPAPAPVPVPVQTDKPARSYRKPQRLPLGDATQLVRGGDAGSWYDAYSGYHEYA